MLPTLPRRLALLCLVAPFLAAWGAPAGAQTVTARGDAGTLDLATWNVEFFGTTSPTDRGDTSPIDRFQVEHVEQAVRQSGIDLWAFQEVSDGEDFAALLDSLSGTGYEGILGPNVSAPNTPFDQKLAFIYDTSVLTITDTTVLELGSFDFAGRLPLELAATATVAGVSRDLRIITIHAKASGDSESRGRRAAASVSLKAYTDGLVSQGLDVVVLGDFNDGLETSGPYGNFVADDAYRFATTALFDGGVDTYCGFNDSSNTCSGGSTIDHILFTESLAGGFVEADRFGELLSDLPQYSTTTSDHLPVLIRIDLGLNVADEAAPDVPPVALAVEPQGREASRVTLRLDAPAAVTLDVFDVRGRRVARLADRAFGAGTHAVDWRTEGLASGLYLVRLQAGPHGVTRTVAITR